MKEKTRDAKRHAELECANRAKGITDHLQTQLATIKRQMITTNAETMKMNTQDESGKMAGHEVRALLPIYT